MIIFDLDGTLADCEHRKHFVDPKKNLTRNCDQYGCVDNDWKPNWEAFYEACDQDLPIHPVIDVYQRLWRENDYYDKIEIWSGRSESVREKTEKWLHDHYITYSILRMRPIDDYTPDDELKELWFHDAVILEGKTIDFVFDDSPKVVKMCRRYGVFVFNCCQHDEEF